jgi:RHS repeat-associated protein
VKYHLSDHVGSSVVALDASGNWLNREEYTPFGESTFGGFARKRYRFVGKERDEESGLYAFGARSYAPHLARWTSCDPVDPKERIRDGPSAFAYAGNNPLKNVDPRGAWFLIIIIVAVAVIAIFLVGTVKTAEVTPAAKHVELVNSGAYDDDPVRELQDRNKAWAKSTPYFESMAAAGETAMVALPGPGGASFEAAEGLTARELLESGGYRAALKRAMETQTDVLGRAVSREIEPAGARVFRHVLDQGGPLAPMRAVQIERGGAMNLSTGGQRAQFGEGVYAWSNTQTGVKRYIDFVVPADTAVEKIVVNDGQTYYRIVPKSGDRVAVKVVGTDMSEAELNAFRPVVDQMQGK